jgi:hypothetical protein
MGCVSIWDSLSRTLIEERRDHESAIVCGQVAAKSLMSQVWTLTADGEIVVTDHESAIRGDDDIFREEIQRRSEEVVFLRDALHNLQEQAVDLEQRCNDRVARMEAQLQRSQEDAELRACQVSDLTTQLEAARAEIKTRDDLIAVKEAGVTVAEDPSQSVRRVMATHLQATERKLMEAESRISRMQTEIQREQTKDRSRQTSVEDLQNYNKLTSALQTAELRAKEFEKHTEDLEEQRKKPS